MSAGLRVGIVGARGIGKHHAKWFARAGCEVTAICGTTAESAAAAGALLRDLMGFQGEAFHDWERFRGARFEMASICSPAEHHWPHVRDLAADGRHLLCEKPVAWNWDYTPEEIETEAARVVEAARQAGVTLAVNAQYPAAIEGWLWLHNEVLGREPDCESLSFTMETKGSPRSPHGAAEVWVDLGPHPLAVLDGLFPGRPDWESLRHSDEPRAAEVQFDWLSGDRRRPVRIACRRTTDGSMRRVIASKEFAVEYSGYTDEQGDFGTRLSAGGLEWKGPDLMRISVERFVEAVRLGDPGLVLVGGEAGLRQQRALTGVYERCWWQPRGRDGSG